MSILMEPPANETPPYWSRAEWQGAMKLSKAAWLIALITEYREQNALKLNNAVVDMALKAMPNQLRKEPITSQRIGPAPNPWDAGQWIEAHRVLKREMALFVAAMFPTRQ